MIEVSSGDEDKKPYFMDPLATPGIGAIEAAPAVEPEQPPLHPRSPIGQAEANRRWACHGTHAPCVDHGCPAVEPCPCPDHEAHAENRQHVPAVEPEQPTDLEMAAHMAGVSMERVADLTRGDDEPESCMHGMRPDQCRPCDYEPEQPTPLTAEAVDGFLEAHKADYERLAVSDTTTNLTAAEDRKLSHDYERGYLSGERNAERRIVEWLRDVWNGCMCTKVDAPCMTCCAADAIERGDHRG